MNLGGYDTAVAIVISIDVLMALAFYFPMSTGALFIVPIGSMGVGAYTAGELAIHGAPLGVVLLGGGCAGAVTAFICGLAVVRMTSWSAAIASLAMVEILQVVMQNFQPIGASSGLLGVPLYTPSLVTYGITAAIIVGLLVLEQTRIGDVLDAIRGNQLAAECSGVKIVRIRLLVFTISGTIAGIAGALSAGFLGFVDPSTYGFSQLNGFLLSAILGGITTALGSLLGGVAVNIVPNLVSFTANYSLIVFSVLVICIVILRPDGLITRRHLKRLVRFVKSKVMSGKPRQAMATAHGKLPRYLSRRDDYSRLHATGITKSYGGVNVVNEADVEIIGGSILGVIGANGAGKTTLVNLLTAVVKPDKGWITGYTETSEKRVSMITQRAVLAFGVARTFQNGRLFPGLTAREHVSLLKGVNGDYLLEMVGLLERADENAMSLPYGDQRLVEIARALATQPRFLILDEPAAGMTNEEAEKVAQLVRRLKVEGMGIMVIDHNVEFIAGISDQMIAMDFGDVVAHGTPGEVLNNPLVEEAYLGKPMSVSATDPELEGLINEEALESFASLIGSMPSERPASSSRNGEETATGEI